MGALPACVHRPPCPGCPNYGQSGLLEETERALRAFSRGLAVEPEIRTGAALGYRVRSRLSVRGHGRRLGLGIFREGSHDLVDIPECAVHHPAINRAAAALRAAMRSTATTAYSDSEHRGLVRSLQVVVERPSGKVQLTLVLNSSTLDASLSVVTALQAALGDQLQGLFLNAHPERNNVILGSDFLRVAGAEATCEQLGGASVFFPPGAFGQANLGLFERVLDDLHSAVPVGERVVEFHAGTGGIGLGLVERSKHYVFNEVNPQSLAGLAVGLAVLPDEARARVDVMAGRAALHAEACREADIVIVDPPRKGLEPELLQALTSAAAPRRLLYLSCSLDSLVRDTAVLAPVYRAERVWAYALFPFTAHVETLVSFERRAT